MVSGLEFRSIHFEFIFVYGVRKWFHVIPLPVAVQFSQHHLLTRLSFPMVYSCLLCHRLIDHVSMDLLLGFPFCPIDLAIFVPIPYCFDSCSFVACFEIWDCDTSSFVLLSQDCFDAVL